MLVLTKSLVIGMLLRILVTSLLTLGAKVVQYYILSFILSFCLSSVLLHGNHVDRFDCAYVYPFYDAGLSYVICSCELC